MSGEEDGVRMTTLVEWIERWRGMMLRVAIGYVGDPEVAEDIVQEALAAALRMARRKPDVEEWVRNPRPWLIGITRNMARSHCRTQARRDGIRQRNEVAIRESLYPPASDGGGIARLRHRIEPIAERVLTARQRQVVREMLDGKDDNEIARAGGMTPGTVRWHRHKAIQRIQSELS